MVTLELSRAVLLCDRSVLTGWGMHMMPLCKADVDNCVSLAVVTEQTQRYMLIMMPEDMEPCSSSICVSFVTMTINKNTIHKYREHVSH